MKHHLMSFILFILSIISFANEYSIQITNPTPGEEFEDSIVDVDGEFIVPGNVDLKNISIYVGNLKAKVEGSNFSVEGYKLQHRGTNSITVNMFEEIKIKKHNKFIEKIIHRATDKVAVTLIHDFKPIAHFRILDREKARAGVPIKFDASQSRDRNKNGSIAKYYWDFGDGQKQIVTQAIIEHIYSFETSKKGKVFHIGLIVEDDKGNKSKIKKKALFVRKNSEIPNLLPVADFTYTPSIVIEGDPVSFTSLATDSDGTIVSYGWMFEGTNTSTEINPVYTFTSSGIITVNLSVTDNRGGQAEISKQIEVVKKNAVPVISLLKYSPESANIVTGAQITFTASAYDIDGEIVTAEFDMGNGEIVSAQKNQDGYVLNYKYLAAGQYTVVFRVKDDLDSFAQSSLMINVDINTPPTISNFKCTPSVIKPGQLFECLVDLKDNETFVSRVVWDFGDGLTIEDEGGETSKQSHVYLQPGIYSLKITAYDSLGESNISTNQIEVKSNIVPMISDLNCLPNPAYVNEEIKCSAVFYDEDGWVESTIWSMGDGTFYQKGVENYWETDHSYTATGNYVLSVVAYDNNHESSTQSITLTIGENQPPVINSFICGNGTVKVGKELECVLDASDSDGEIKEIIYNWGDGIITGTGSVPESNPKHTYSTPGSFVVSVTIRDNLNATANTSLEFQVLPNQAPVIGNINCNPKPYKLNEEITCEADISDTDGLITEIVWDWGNGNVSGVGDLPSESAKNIFTSYGEYSLIVSATDDSGAKTTKTSQLVIYDDQISCPGYAQVGALVTCTIINNSNEIDFSTVTWSMGNGFTTVTSDTNSIDYAYESRGLYEISAEVRYQNGSTNTLIAYININESPTAMFTCSETTPLVLICDASASYDPDNNIAGYAWVFDGVFLSGKIVSYVYQLPGDYYINLWVYDTLGGVGASQQNISVGKIPQISQLSYFPYDLENPKNLKIIYKIEGVNSSSIDNITMDFGDETIESTESLTGEFYHQYSADGEKFAILSLKTTNGTIIEKGLSIDINPSFQVGVVELAGSSRIENETVLLKALPVNNTEAIASYSWRLPDASLVSGDSLEYTFAKAGDYKVLIRATTVSGVTAFKEVEIKIFETGTTSQEQAQSAGSWNILGSENNLYPILAPIQIEVVGADLDVNKPLSIAINDIQVTADKYVIQNNLVMINVPLVDGKNNIEIFGEDTTGALISGSFEIIAGSKTITLNFLDESSTPVTGAKAEICLFKENICFNKVADQNGNLILNNIPNNTTLSAGASIEGISGTTQIDTSSGNTYNVILFGFAIPSTDQNNDFTGNLIGWNFVGGVSEILPKQNHGFPDIEGNVASFNIDEVTGKLTLTRTFKTNPGIKSVQFRFLPVIDQIGVSLKAELRSSYAGDIDFINLNVENENDLSTFTQNDWRYLEVKTNEIDTVEVKLVIEKVNGQGMEIFKNIINNFMANAYAQSSGIGVKTPGVLEQKFFVDILDFYTYTTFGARPELNALSLGDVPFEERGFTNIYSQGDHTLQNIISMDLQTNALCGIGQDHSAVRLRLIIKNPISGVVGIVDQSENVFLECENDKCVIHNSNRIFNIAVNQMREFDAALSSNSHLGIQLSSCLGVFDDLKNVFYKKEKSPKLLKNYDLFNWSKFPGKFFNTGSMPKDNEKGGDKWFRKDLLDSLDKFLSDVSSKMLIQVNDMAFLNGGQWDHESHQKGTKVDVFTPHFSPYNPNATLEAAEDLIKILRSQYSNDLNNILVTTSAINSNDSFIRRIKYECSSDKERIFDMLVNKNGHNDHFHFGFDPEYKNKVSSSTPPERKEAVFVPDETDASQTTLNVQVKNMDDGVTYVFEIFDENGKWIVGQNQTEGDYKTLKINSQNASGTLRFIKKGNYIVRLTAIDDLNALDFPGTRDNVSDARNRSRCNTQYFPISIPFRDFCSRCGLDKMPEGRFITNEYGVSKAFVSQDFMVEDDNSLGGWGIGLCGKGSLDARSKIGADVVLCKNVEIKNSTVGDYNGAECPFDKYIENPIAHINSGRITNSCFTSGTNCSFEDVVMNDTNVVINKCEGLVDKIETNSLVGERSFLEIDLIKESANLTSLWDRKKLKEISLASKVNQCLRVCETAYWDELVAKVSCQGGGPYNWKNTFSFSMQLCTEKCNTCNGLSPLACEFNGSFSINVVDGESTYLNGSLPGQNLKCSNYTYEDVSVDWFEKTVVTDCAKMISCDENHFKPVCASVHDSIYFPSCHSTYTCDESIHACIGDFTLTWDAYGAEKLHTNAIPYCTDIYNAFK